MSNIKENAKLSADNKMLEIFNSTMSHELLTPLRCVNHVAMSAKSKQVSPEVYKDLELIINATDLLMNSVKGSLDKKLLE
jgi:signal transduction histidine kinase